MVLYMLNFIRKNKINIAFRESCDKYYESIFRYCYCMMGNENDAKDCTQETFVRYLVRLEKETPIENHRAYLYKIAKSICIEYTHQIERRNRDIADYINAANIVDTLSIEEQVDVENIEKHIDQIISEILDTLNIEDKALYSDYYIHKLTYKQIAFNQNVSEAAICKRMKTIRRTIEKLIQEAINKGGDLNG